MNDEVTPEMQAELVSFLVHSNRHQRRAAGFTFPLPARVRQIKLAMLHAPSYGHPRLKDRYGRLLTDEEYYEKYQLRLRDVL